MILVIDNYDSFTFNLVHYLQQLGTETHVVRNDQLSVDDALALKPEAILLSPGPGTPDKTGISLDLVRAVAETRLPLLGVCLGHQAIAAAFGGKVVRAHELMHGKLSPISHDGSGLFAGLPNPFQATRYHSLMVERDSLPAELRVTAETEGSTIMGLAHASLPLHGVQFHPESIASEQGHALLANFLDLANIAHRPVEGLQP